MPGSSAAVSGVVSLQVQSVLFDNVPADLDRSLDALARAIELASERGVLDRVVVAWGDCSPAPTFDDDGVAATGTMTWYDSRANKKHRSAECRRDREGQATALACCVDLPWSG